MIDLQCHHDQVIHQKDKHTDTVSILATKQKADEEDTSRKMLMSERNRLRYLLTLIALFFSVGRRLHLVATATLLRTSSSSSSSSSTTMPIPIRGWGSYRYVYEPSFLPVPPEANVEHAHGIAVYSTLTTTGRDDWKKTSNGTASSSLSSSTTNINIIITYKDVVDPTKCLLQWKTNDLTNVGEFLGPNDGSLCSGVPHGLISINEIEDEDDDDNNKDRTVDDTRSIPHHRDVRNTGRTVLYHANNEQTLHKTTIKGEIIWSVRGPLDASTTSSPHELRPHDVANIAGDYDDDMSYRPTWFASQPGSPYMYLADGYGSSKIYVLNRTDGTYTGHTFGGYGTDHGTFQTCHSISWDDRYELMVVSDRENHRLEYFYVDPADPSIFRYVHTVSFDPLLQRPCNVRIRTYSHDNNDIHYDDTTTVATKTDDENHQTERRDVGADAIIPFLEGTVGIVNRQNNLIAYVNVSDTLGNVGFLHPHDVHFVPNTDGDFVLVTWNPGRIGYFRRVHVVDDVYVNDDDNDGTIPYVDTI